ncbi:MAG: hypothetical protein ABI721_02910 [Candidatus Dojkabacteria bacterium]
MEILLSILKFLAKAIMTFGYGILWLLEGFDIFGIGKFFNGSGKESLSKIATEHLPSNSDLPR